MLLLLWIEIKAMKPLPTLLSLLLLVGFGAGCLSPRDVRKYPDPHGHKVVAVHMQTNSVFHAQDLIKHRPIDIKYWVKKGSKEVLSPSGTKSVGLGQMKSGLNDVDVIILKKSQQPVACFISTTWQYRWFDGLAWLDDRLVAVDLWTGPNFGWHYVIDTKREKVLFAGAYWNEYDDIY